MDFDVVDAALRSSVDALRHEIQSLYSRAARVEQRLVAAYNIFGQPTRLSTATASDEARHAWKKASRELPDLLSSKRKFVVEANRLGWKTRSVLEDAEYFHSNAAAVRTDWLTSTESIFPLSAEHADSENNLQPLILLCLRAVRNLEALWLDPLRSRDAKLDSAAASCEASDGRGSEPRDHKWAKKLMEAKRREKNLNCSTLAQLAEQNPITYRRFRNGIRISGEALKTLCDQLTIGVADRDEILLINRELEKVYVAECRHEGRRK